MVFDDRSSDIEIQVVLKEMELIRQGSLSQDRFHCIKIKSGLMIFFCFLVKVCHVTVWVSTPA